MEWSTATASLLQDAGRDLGRRLSVASVATSRWQRPGSRPTDPNAVFLRCDLGHGTQQALRAVAQRPDVAHLEARACLAQGIAGSVDVEQAVGSDQR